VKYRLHNLSACALVFSVWLRPCSRMSRLTCSNLNGTAYCPGSSSVGACSSNGGLAAVPGLSSTLDTSQRGGTGLGYLTLTYNPVRAVTRGFLIFEQLQQTRATTSTAAPGKRLGPADVAIDVPDYDYAGEAGTSGARHHHANTLATPCGH